MFQSQHGLGFFRKGERVLNKLHILNGVNSTITDRRNSNITETARRNECDITHFHVTLQKELKSMEQIFNIGRMNLLKFQNPSQKVTRISNM